MQSVTALSSRAQYFSRGPPPFCQPATPSSSANSTHLCSQLLLICNQLSIYAPATHPIIARLFFTIMQDLPVCFLPDRLCLTQPVFDLIVFAFSGVLTCHPYCSVKT